MPRTQALIGGEGTTFRNSFVSLSLCCPSRATLLTGRYAHNHGVLDLVPPRGGYERARPQRDAGRLAPARRLRHRAAGQVPQPLRPPRPDRGAGRVDGVARAGRPLDLLLLRLHDQRRRRADALRLRAVRLPDRRADPARGGDHRPPRRRGRAVLPVGQPTSPRTTAGRASSTTRSGSRRRSPPCATRDAFAGDDVPAHAGLRRGRRVRQAARDPPPAAAVVDAAVGDRRALPPGARVAAGGRRGRRGGSSRRCAAAASWRTRSSCSPPTTASCTASTGRRSARCSPTSHRSGCRC